MATGKKYLFVHSGDSICGVVGSSVESAYDSFDDYHGDRDFEGMTCYEVVKVEVRRTVQVIESTKVSLK